MATPLEWSRAYAGQAEADYDAWLLLEESALPDCQKLHFLQMACEKLTKAHLCRAGSEPQDLQTSHAYIAKNLPRILREELEETNSKQSLIRDLLRAARPLAREIELLSPAVDAGGRRPDNCEYPWEDAKGAIRLPTQHAFNVRQLILQRHGRSIVKLIRSAIVRYLL